MANKPTPPIFDDRPTPVGSRPPPLPMLPPWYILARRELGQREVAGTAGHNPRILEYHKSCKGGEIADDETPWCSAFCNFVMLKGGVVGTQRRNARSWLTWGVELKEPKVGCIVVFWRDNPKSAKGHVGFYVGRQGGNILVLGGNQLNSVSVASYPAMRLLGYRWPNGVAVPK